MWKKVALVVGVALLVGGSASGARKAAPSNTSPPTVSGTAREGETFTASSGSWSGSTPITFTYRWQRCSSSGNNCSNISGATTQTYTLKDGDGGRTFRVSVTATNSDGSANAVSGASAVVANGQAPANTSSPTISGTAKDGETLTAANGSWSNNPTGFDYRWRRCNTSGDNCSGTGSRKQTYKLDVDDVGSTIRVRVEARNQFGSSKATSAPTGVVAPRGPLPVNTAPPVISGTTRDGQTLAASTGTWTNSPTKFAYKWLRCDTAGNNCASIGSNQTQRLTASDISHTIRVTVSATNGFGTSTATSVPTAVVASATSGPSSIPVDQVSLPNQLVISAVKFTPTRLTTRAPFIARFKITDAHGNLVRGALVYSIALPYGWIRPAPEATTATDGWATIQFFPTSLMPLHGAAAVFFVRARKPGESLLAGVAARRLVQVRIG